MQLGFVSKQDVGRVLEEQQRLQRAGRGHKMMGLCMVEMGLLSTTQLVEVLRQYEKNGSR